MKYRIRILMIAAISFTLFLSACTADSRPVNETEPTESILSTETEDGFWSVGIDNISVIQFNATKIRAEKY